MEFLVFPLVLLPTSLLFPEHVAELLIGSLPLEDSPDA